MARRRVEAGSKPENPPPEASKVTLPYDTANECAIIAASFLNEEARAYTIVRLVPDHFQQREHRELWTAFQEIERRKLAFDLPLVENLTNQQIREYLAELCEIRPEAPKNLEFHVQCILWDHARVSSARGPIPAFIEALRDPKSEPERVRALARAIATSFDGYEDRKYLHDPEVLVRDQMKEIEARVNGRATFPYGIDGLDFLDRAGPREEWRRRMLPGAAPSQITVVTGVSGGGKTTFTAHIVLGIAFPGWRKNDFESLGRSLLYGSWEMSGGMTLELLSCISLGWSRSELMEGRGPIATPMGRQQLHARMGVLNKRIRFMGNPFRRRSGEKASNEKNLDIVQGYIADSGCEVFVGDLWKRCLRHTDPDEEEDALIRQQAMAEELKIHAILLQQQRLKDVEMRADKRPTREGIKGSGAWVEVADTILGVHNPSLFKRVPPDTLEVFVLKQRYGRWPTGVEFRWDADSGMVTGGVPIEYDRPGEQNEIDGGTSLAAFRSKRGK
jgi:replicative DNA helicase